jgi:GPH family glycoside/pentoside/hexuronide:cation symporter
LKSISLRNIIYAFPAFAFSIPTFPVMIMLPAFFAEVHGFEITVIGILIFLSKLIDVITDPLVGWLNDKNFFPRKIYLLIGGILSGLALTQLFLKQDIDQEIFLLVWLSILYLGWTMFQIPYLSIGYDLEKNYFLRTKLSATREFFILLGLFFSLGIPMFFSISNEKLLENIVFIASFFGLIGLILFCSLIQENRRTNEKKIKFSKVIKNLRKNIYFSKIFSVLVLNNLANVFPMVLFAFFITYVLGGDDSNRQTTLFFYFLFAIIGVPFWTIISKKFGKKEVWSLSLFLSAMFFLLVFFLENGNFLFFIIISCITGFCLGADLIIPPSIQADITDWHLSKFGEDISGVLFSIITFLNKFAFAVVSIFVFGIMGALDFDTDGEINANARLFIIISYALAPILLKLLAAYLLINFKLKENELQKIQKKIYG